VVESGLDDMGLDGALGVAEAVTANPNTTKRSKKKKNYNTHSDSLPKIFLKQPKSKQKSRNQALKLYCYEPTKRGEIRN
jgi:hypothetical protein